MQRQQKSSSRIDLADLKGQIVKRIGAQRSHRYFLYLGDRLFTQRFGKNEFDKLCIHLIGKENLSLHNHFIRSIFKNACYGIVPPNVFEDGLAVKSVHDDGRKQSGYTGFAQNLPWSNGVLSPKKSKPCIRDRKLKDQPSLLMFNGTVAHTSHLASVTSDRIITENGEISSCDYQRPVHKLQELAELPISESEISVHQPIEKLVIQRLIRREDALRNDDLSIHAPLGIPFCGSSVGGSCRPMPSTTCDGSCYNDAFLPDTVSLQKRMGQMALDHGLEEVSMESANILNSGLDFYIKRLITSCVSMVNRRSGYNFTKQVSQKQQIQSKFMNGILPSNHHYMENNGGPVEALQEHSSFSSISMLDFKVAMELNPQQLGEYWPLVLEKISMDQFSE